MGRYAAAFLDQELRGVDSLLLAEAIETSPYVTARVIKAFYTE